MKKETITQYYTIKGETICNISLKDRPSWKPLYELYNEGNRLRAEIDNLQYETFETEEDFKERLDSLYKQLTICYNESEMARDITRIGCNEEDSTKIEENDLSVLIIPLIFGLLILGIILL